MKFGGLEEIIKDIVLGSQMRVHQNVQKLLGCCLETESSIIVYEFVEARNVYNCICIPPTERVRSKPLAWKCKLRIAMGIAMQLHTSILHFQVLLSIEILGLAPYIGQKQCC